MRSQGLTVAFAIAFGLAYVPATRVAPAAECCDTGGCTICKPKWENKKTKKPKYSQKCTDECVRGFDAWCDHGCCPECTPPHANVFTRKKLYKREEDKVERVLKYDLVEAADVPCVRPPCGHCKPAWYDLRGILCRCLAP